MNKSIYVITGVLALTITGVALSQEQDQERSSGMPMMDRDHGMSMMNRDHGMSEMDADGNGTVEKSEFTAMYDKRFADTDTDGGGISLDEYKAKVQADREARDAERAERDAERDAKRAEKKAEKEANREEREAKRAQRDAERTQKRFESLDADGDGTVSADEYKAAGDKMFERMDRNDDGILNDRRDRRRGDRDHKGPRGPKPADDTKT